MGIKTKTAKPTVAALAFRRDLVDAMIAAGARHKLSGAEVLAVLGHLVGAAIAMQDQRTMTPDDCFDLVAENIQQGNAEAISEIMKPARGSA